MKQKDYFVICFFKHALRKNGEQMDKSKNLW